MSVIAACLILVFSAPVNAAGHTRARQVFVMFDFSGGTLGAAWDLEHRLRLSEVGGAGGHLEYVKHDGDWAIQFPRRCPSRPLLCPRAILQSGRAELLNPGRAAFRWGASVKMIADETSTGSNIVQKGRATSGTQYKLQVDGKAAHPSCAISGGQRIYLAEASFGIADGQWHNLECQRIDDSISLYVDGVLAAAASLPSSVSIVNRHPLRVGGKGAGPNNDQYHGSIDDVLVDIE